LNKPTKPNKTKIATAADCVMTKKETAFRIVKYFNPIGSILDPCSGNGAFFDSYENEEKYKCDISYGKDFFDWEKKVDWIITNPPYSIYDYFLDKALKIADNVVFFCPIAKAFKSNRVQKMVIEYGGLKEIVYMGTGGKYGFGFGFPVGCLYYKRNYRGDCKISHKIDFWI